MPKDGGHDKWETIKEYKPWTLRNGDGDDKKDVLRIGDEGVEGLESLKALVGVRRRVRKLWNWIGKSIFVPNCPQQKNIKTEH